MSQLAHLPGYSQWVGHPGTWPDLLKSVTRLKQCVNVGQHTVLQGQPLLLLLLLLEDMLQPFKWPCLSAEGLSVMAAVYEDLHYQASSHPLPLQFVWEAEVSRRRQ